MSVSYDFSDKTAVVTGGSKGIGYAIANKLKSSGARVWNWDIARVQQDGVTHLNIDVTDVAQIDSAISTVLRQSSQINILVNNAGLLGLRSRSNN